jgi:hypothetical protein
MGGPTSSICYRQHNSRDHVTTQAHHYVKVGISAKGISIIYSKCVFIFLLLYRAF